MLYKQEGFVIRSVDYGENNKIITILNEHGHKVPLMARGAKNKSSTTRCYTALCTWLVYFSKV